MHAHRHMHSSPVQRDQKWHKDSYWGTRKLRHHRPRWMMALYYPKDVTLSMGPTYVLPFSQYATIDTEHVHYGEDRLGMYDSPTTGNYDGEISQRWHQLDSDTAEIYSP